MLLYGPVVQTENGSYFKAFALPGEEKPLTGVCPGSTIEEFDPEEGSVVAYSFDGTEWEPLDNSDSQE